MAEFVHLHLHTEYSLLDGACRIGELLAEAERLKMPALAVTEHGNLFSSIVFHDKARQRGIKPILGCEVYVAPGSRLTKGGPISETANHLILLAETNEGFHNLVKLTSSAYTEGFYYKPRIDKELLARHSKGLIGLSSCLKGEVPSALRADQFEAAANAAATYRDILGAGNFFLELQFQGIEEQRIVNNGLLPLSRDLGIPLVCTNDVHYLRRDDFRPHDVLLCIGTGRTVNDAERMRYYGDQFYLKTPEEMAAVFGHLPDAMRNTVAIADRCEVDLSDAGPYLPNFQVPEGFTLEGYFEHVVREGFDDAPRAAGGAARRRVAASFDRRVPHAPAVRNRRHQADAVPGILPDHLGLHPLRAGAGHSGGAGARVGRRQPRGVLPAHHRRGPAAVRPAVRAFPQPRAHLAAGHRHRLLRAPPGRGDRVRHAEVRARERGADHHLRHHEGEGRRARRRARDGHALRRRGPRGQADPRRAGDDPRQGARGEPGAARDGEERLARGRPARRGQAPRGHGPPRVGARRGRRDRAEAHHRVRPALQGEPRRNHHPVGDEGDRAHRPAQDGFPGAEHADAHPRRPRADRDDRRRADRDGGAAPHRREDVRPVLRRPDPRHLPVRELRHAPDPPAGQAEEVRRPHRPERPLPPRADQGRHDRRLRQPEARPRRGPVRAREAAADSRGHLRRHGLPGAGHARGERTGRLQPRRGRPAAQGDGEEEPRPDAGAARQVRRRRDRPRHQREEGHARVRPDGAVRRVRLQQVALDGVRAARVPDGVPEGQLPVALHGRAADHRVAEHGEAGLLSPRVP